MHAIGTRCSCLGIPLPILARAATTALRRAGPGAAADSAAAPGTSGVAILQSEHAIHPHVPYAGGELLGLLVGGVILHGGGIKDDYVREVALAQAAAIADREGLGRKGGELADCLLQREHFIVAHVFAEHAREVAVGAWMLGREQEHPLGGRRGSIRAEADPRQCHLAADVV